MILLNALRGGKIEWQVGVNSQYIYKDNVLSITGISKKIQLDGGYTSATVTISLYGVDDEILIGQPVSVFFRDFSQEESINIWDGNISAINKNSQNILELTCVGRLSLLDKDKTLYIPTSETPRTFYQKMLINALPFSYVSVPNYNDNYHRNATRVSTKYTTLANLSGVATYDAPTINTATALYAGSYQSLWSLTLNDDYCFFDLQDWNVFLNKDHPVKNSPTNPLVWHRRGTCFRFSSYFFGRAGSSTVFSYWPCGEDHDINLYIDIKGDYSAYNDSLGFQYTNNNGDLSALNYISLRPSDSSREYPNATYTTWKDTASTILQQSWTPQNSTILDSRALKYDLSSWNSSGNNIYLGYSAGHQFSGTIMYNHLDASTEIKQRISNYSTRASRHNLVQKIYPVTINSNLATWENATQAAFLGSVAIFECGENYGFKVVDTCPEKGTIYEIPICKSTCNNVEFMENHPLPTTIKANFVNPYGKEYNYNISLNDNLDLKEEKEINIMQGLLAGVCAFAINGPYYNLAGDDWFKNPGFCIDRWTGVSMSNNYTTNFDIFSEGYSVELKLQGSDGTIIRLPKNFYDDQSSMNPTGSTMYEVRTKDNQVIRNFADHAFINPIYDNGSYRYLPPTSDPWLDIFPVTQLKNANNRVFINNLRPSWRVQVPLAFVNCEPGAVVIIDLIEIAKEPYLALVIGNECSSESDLVTLEIMPMFPASGASSNDWLNINEILNIATAQNAGDAGIAFLPSVQE